MRKFVSAILIFQFLLMNMGSLRFVAQYELFSDYIASKLCIKKDIANNDCQGQCHLNKEMVNFAEDTENQESALLTETSYLVLFPCEIIEFRKSLPSFDPIISVFAMDVYPYQPSFAVFHPPTV